MRGEIRRKKKRHHAIFFRKKTRAHVEEKERDVRGDRTARGNEWWVCGGQLT